MSQTTASRYELPVVTGISPKEGIPGTQITIRGEHLGLSQNDLIGLQICGADCSLSARWESTRKIIARVTQSKAVVGDVIVTTRTGGRGSSTVQFRVFTVQIGPLQESAVWVDESRTVPALQRESVNTAGLVDDDPLQISSKIGRKIPMDPSFAEIFPDGSSNIRLENFAPAWFLVENYPNASFEDLKRGLINAQRQNSTMGREGPKDFLKTNLPSFVRCVDALSELKSKMDEHEEKPTDLCAKADALVNECANQANKLFADVLNRKERADATRNALSVLQRFKFLFFLPHNIDKHLEKGDYALIINDYSRAKSLFCESDVPLFKEAYQQVEQRIEAFRKTLEEKLLEMPSSLDEQKKIIRYLLLLKPDTDAGWTCLSATHYWLNGLLWDSQDKHYKAAVQAAHLYDEDTEDERMGTELSHRFYFVDSVATIFTSKLQQFYKLGQAYIHGQLSSAPNLHKEEQIEGMVQGIIQLGVWLVLNAILPETVPASSVEQYKSRLVTWPDEFGHDSSVTMNLLQTLKTFRSCVSSLLQQEFGSKQLQPLYELCITLRINCLARVVEQTCQSVVDLHHRENWKIQNSQKDDEWSKTATPDLFERLTGDSWPLLKQIASNSGFPGEQDLMSSNQDKLRSTLLYHFERLISSYEQMLRKLAKLPHTGGDMAVEEDTVSKKLQRPENLHVDTIAPLKDKKLLIVLSNCDYALRFSVAKCIERIKGMNAKFAEQLRERCIPKYGNLRTLLLKMYIGAKCAPFISLAESLNYDTVSENDEVSNIVKDMLLCIVSVNAELFLISPQFSNQVMSFVVRNCCEQFCDVLSKYSARNQEKQATQIVTDLTAFEEAVTFYLSGDTRKMLDEAKRPFTCNAKMEKLQSAVAKFNLRMKMVLLSLQEQNVSA